MQKYFFLLLNALITVSQAWELGGDNQNKEIVGVSAPHSFLNCGGRVGVLPDASQSARPQLFFSSWDETPVEEKYEWMEEEDLGWVYSEGAELHVNQGSAFEMCGRFHVTKEFAAALNDIVGRGMLLREDSQHLPDVYRRHQDGTFRSFDNLPTTIKEATGHPCAELYGDVAIVQPEYNKVEAFVWTQNGGIRPWDVMLTAEDSLALWELLKPIVKEKPVMAKLPRLKWNCKTAGELAEHLRQAPIYDGPVQKHQLEPMLEKDSIEVFESKDKLFACVGIGRYATARYSGPENIKKRIHSSWRFLVYRRAHADEPYRYVTTRYLWPQMPGPLQYEGGGYEEINHVDVEPFLYSIHFTSGDSYSFVWCDTWGENELKMAGLSTQLSYPSYQGKLDRKNTIVDEYIPPFEKGRPLIKEARFKDSLQYLHPNSFETFPFWQVHKMYYTPGEDILFNPNMELLHAEEFIETEEE